MPVYGGSKMEAKKRAVACLIGGIVGMIVALFLKPALGWVLAGMASGASLAYLAYDLRQFIEMAPKAWRATKKPCLELLSAKEFHPLIFNGVILGGLSAHNLWQAAHPEMPLGAKVLLAILFFWVMGLIGFFCSGIFCDHGARKKLISIKDTFGSSRNEPIPATYKNVYWLMGIGAADIPILLLRACLLIPSFLINLMRLIHCHGRVASAIYCAAGIFISCLLWGRVAQTPAECIFATFAGGAIGAVLASTTCEISRRFGWIPQKQ